MPDEMAIEQDANDTAQQKARADYAAVSKAYNAASKRLDSLTMELLVTKGVLAKLEAQKSALLAQFGTGYEVQANGNGKGKGHGKA